MPTVRAIPTHSSRATVCLGRIDNHDDKKNPAFKTRYLLFFTLFIKEARAGNSESGVEEFICEVKFQGDFHLINSASCNTGREQ
jgi:hypothetical protein